MSFYQPDCILKLKYDSFRPVLTYNLLTRHVIYYKKCLDFFSPSIRMSGKNIIFNDNKINKSNFYKNKKLSKIDDIDVNEILISKKEPCDTKNSFKYFI